jgi:hypothetical protein
MAFERYRKYGVDGKKRGLIISRSRGQSITLTFGEATMKIRVICLVRVLSSTALTVPEAEACLFKYSNLTNFQNYNIMSRNQGRRE